MPVILVTAAKLGPHAAKLRGGKWTFPTQEPVETQAELAAYVAAIADEIGQSDADYLGSWLGGSQPVKYYNLFPKSLSEALARLAGKNDWLRGLVQSKIASRYFKGRTELLDKKTEAIAATYIAAAEAMMQLPANLATAAGSAAKGAGAALGVGSWLLENAWWILPVAGVAFVGITYGPGLLASGALKKAIR